MITLVFRVKIYGLLSGQDNSSFSVGKKRIPGSLGDVLQTRYKIRILSSHKKLRQPIIRAAATFYRSNSSYFFGAAFFVVAFLVVAAFVVPAFVVPTFFVVGPFFIFTTGFLVRCLCSSRLVAIPLGSIRFKA